MTKEQILAIIQRGHVTDGDLADAILAELAKVQEPVGYRYISPDGGWSFSEMKHGDFASPVYSHPAPSVPEGYVVVPIEPTPKIKAAMCSVLLDDKEAQFCYDLSWEEATELYKKALQQGASKWDKQNNVDHLNNAKH